MRIVFAPDSFKGSIDARSAAAELASGWREVRPADELILLPQADGGEGTLDAISAALPNSQRFSAGMVAGPDGRKTPGEWLQLANGTAIVELAQCAGIGLMARLDAMRASSRGLGEVIRAAVEAGAEALVIGLGGSASTDGGAGALSALGLKLTDARDNSVRDGGAGLANIVSAEPSGLISPPPGGVTLLADVTTPLLGTLGSAAIFGPQKGASATECALLDKGLSHFARLVGGDPTASGSGAAGGTAFGFATFWNAQTISGAAYIAELTGLTSAGADVILTGEGRFDEQSLMGKVVGNALRLSARVGVVAGQVAIQTDAWTISLSTLAGSTQAALATPRVWLRRAGAQAARDLA